MMYDINPTEGSTTNDRFCSYYFKVGEQKIGSAEIQLPGVFDPVRQAILHGHTLEEPFRGRRTGLSREMDSYVLSDLINRGVRTLRAYVPYCFELITNGGDFRYEYLWEPPIDRATGLQEEGGFRSAKILLTPHLPDGTPIHAVLTNAQLVKKWGSIFADLSLEIDLRDKREGNWKIVDEVAEISKYSRIILCQPR